jgi:hypothetical protein
MRVRRTATASNTTPRPPASSGTNSRLESLNEADAACYLGMSAAWLKKSRTKAHRNRSDALPFVRVGTRRVVYCLVDIDAWQLAHLVDGMTPTPVQLVQNSADGSPTASLRRGAFGRRARKQSGGRRREQDGGGEGVAERHRILQRQPTTVGGGARP